MLRKIDDVANAIKKITGNFTPQTAVILGSGLSGYADGIDVKYNIEYGKIEGFPRTSVAGHSGRLIFGTKQGKDIVIMSGRVHYYEGFSMSDVVLPVRVLKRLGIKNLIVTNAAGSVNKSYNAGDIMLIKNHISLFCPNPLMGANIDELGERFPDMTYPYDRDYIAVAKKCAANADIDLKEGVYCYVTGPSYESAADINAIRILGGDSVGMSTVPEVIAARHAGIRVCGFSFISNKGAGIAEQLLSHSEVIQIFDNIGKKMFNLIDAMLENI